MERFVDDDNGYLQWLAAHPDGFVLNAERRPAPGYLVLHRATCRTVNAVPARGLRWTADYTKLCGTQTELEQFARQDIGGTANPCRICIR